MIPILKSRLATLSVVAGIVIMFWGCVVSVGVLLLVASTGPSVEILGLHLRYSAVVLGMSLAAFVLCCVAAALLEWLNERDTAG